MKNKQSAEIKVPHAALVIKPSWAQVFTTHESGNENEIEQWVGTGKVMHSPDTFWNHWSNRNRKWALL